MGIFLVFGEFGSATWHWSLLARQFFVMPVITANMINMEVMGDEGTSFGQTWLIRLAAVVTLEASIYINMRDKAQLFLQVKTIEQQ